MRKTKRIKLGRVLYDAQGGQCFFCNAPMLPIGYHHHKCPGGFTFDHLRPKARGGRDIVRNLVLACNSCNGAKGDREPTNEEYKRFKNIRFLRAKLWCSRRLT